MAIPKLSEAASKGSYASQGGPDDDGSDENFGYGGPKTLTGPLSRQAHGSPMSPTSVPLDQSARTILSKSRSPYTPSMLASAPSTSALKTPRQPAPNQSPIPAGAPGRQY